MLAVIAAAGIDLRAPRKIAAQTELCESPVLIMIDSGDADGSARVLRCRQAVGGTVHEGRSARNDLGFRAEIEAVVYTPNDSKKSNAGRKPLDAIVLFRM